MQAQWQKAAVFHGHECPGLAIGVRASLAAIEKMNITRAEDEELLCITETNACGVDAIQALTGCTLGKGNLILKNRGKQAFTFLNRTKEEAMRFYLVAKAGDRSREAFIDYLLNAPLEEVFTYKKVPYVELTKARRFPSGTCARCQESTGEYWLRLEDGETVCLDCVARYERDWD